jgi:hypothetical protein
MAALYNTTSNTAYQQFTRCPAAEHESSLEYVQKHNMRAVYTTTSCKTDSSLLHDQQQ